MRHLALEGCEYSKWEAGVAIACRLAGWSDHWPSSMPDTTWFPRNRSQCDRGRTFRSSHSELFCSTVQSPALCGADARPRQNTRAGLWGTEVLRERRLLWGRGRGWLRAPLPLCRSFDIFPAPSGCASKNTGQWPSSIILWKQSSSASPAGTYQDKCYLWA